ncbi:Ran-binding protein 10 [Entomophthora muscae]|uniref:Ran-binding protein 10 n=1 Tax=Entomophthora muscae TaxID=34485 RepID=A0ACC2TCC6_9FUNG|nr:Ran-binding protein 10 [Entomophthora muscae]
MIFTYSLFLLIILGFTAYAIVRHLKQKEEQGLQDVYTAPSFSYRVPVVIDLNDIDSSQSNTASLDFNSFGHTVSRTGKHAISFSRPTLIHTNYPVPLSEDGFYFEILCLRLPMGSELVLGLSPLCSSAANRLFGQYSLALNITRGAILTKNTPISYPALSSIEVSDVIGCLVTASPSLSVIFSRNGIAGHSISVKNDSPHHISLTGTNGVHILYNFGHDEFLYSIAKPPAPYTAPPEYSPQ